MTLDNFRSIDLTLDFANQYLSTPEVTAIAGDASGRKLHLTITDKGVVQDLTSQNIVLYWKHYELGNSGMATFTATDPKNGVFDLFLPTELLHAGRVDANIQVVDSPSHSAVMSRALIIRVESSAYDDKAAMATNAYTSLQDILTLWQTLPKQIQDWLTKYANVQINQGGTGASTRPVAFNNLALIGADPITTPSDDTPANWHALGSGYAWYTKNNELNNQPGQYGHLIQYNQPTSNEILQIFSVSPTGEMYYRKANSTGWRGRADDNGTWTRLSDSRNPLPVLAADASSTGMAYTITNSTVSNGFPNGYTFKFVPNVNSSTPNATLAINGGTAYPFYKIDTYTGAFVQVSSSNTSSGFLGANNATTITYIFGKWILNDEPIPNGASISGIVPMNKIGGTPQALTSGDANTLTSGFYNVRNMTNMPTTGVYNLIVVPNETNADYIQQLAFTIGLSSVMYIRSQNNGTWGSWKKSIDSSGMGIDYAQAHPVNSVITNSSSSSSGYNVGTWSNIGSATIGSTTLYYWKRTA